MPKTIVIVQGHPDPAGNHLCHALADAYAKGAADAGHRVSWIEVAKLEFPLLRSKEDFEKGSVPPGLAPAQKLIGAADHLVFVYPLWLGTLPALLKGFLEQIARPGFALVADTKGGMRPNLKGKSARIIVTMGMPALIYRWYFGAHGLKSFERSILRFCGITPVRESLFGLVESGGDEKRRKWLKEMTALGAVGR
jgi:putative NADPH-quinone reductase